MNELFGLSMTYIMIALLVILAVAAGSIGWIVLRNRVMFFIGLRNIPRRRAQTVLIVIGLMLSTLIISTAFGIGDTVDYSITNQVYERMHSIDEVVQAQSDKETGHFDASAVITAKPITDGQARQYTDSFLTIPGVDGALSIIRGPVPVKDQRSGQSEPLVVLVGLDPRHMQGFESDITTPDGRQVSISALGADDVYVNESAADKLDIQTGDLIQVFTGGQPHLLTVRDIVKDRVLTGTVLGTPQGIVTTLGRAQELFGRSEVDMIAVSNTGGVRDSMGNGKQIKDALNQQLQGTSWRAVTAKADAVDEAATMASVFTTLFVVLGLFSIAAGMMLIFLIFVMLAAERKVEMGMMRAVGTKRSHLVQTYMSEGMAYNVGAAAIGAALGVAVSVAMVQIMAALFSQFDLSIVFHISARSLVVSYSLGVVLTFLTVTFSSWRIGNLNIVSAIRDAADPVPQRTRPEWNGNLWSLMTHTKWLVFKPSRLIEWAVGLGLMVAAAPLIALCVVSFMIATAIYGMTGAASVVAVLIGVVGIGAAVMALVAAAMGLTRLFQMGALSLVIGAMLIVLAFATNLASPYGIGVTLVLLGIALSLVSLRAPARPVFTTMGVLVLVYWVLGAGGHLPPKRLEGDIDLFFVSGFIMVLAGTFIIVYNADLMLALLTRMGGSFPRLVPAIRTAVAYPLANKFRTGMTIAMISLVMFALVMMSTMNSNFSRLFLGDEAQGGYDVVVTENPSNPIPNMKAALQAANQDTSAIEREDDLRVANRRVAEVRMAPKADGKGDSFSKYSIVGPSENFIDGNQITFQARQEGLATDADVWRTLRDEPDTAVIDAFALPSGGFGPPGAFVLSDVKSTVTSFKSIEIEVRDSSEPSTVKKLRIVGIFSLKASAVYNGLFLSPQAFNTIFPKPESTMHLMKLTPGTDSVAVAKMIEKTLTEQGVQADSLRKLIEDQQAQNQGFMYLIDGFMGIGLFVGIAAVGVIAFRTVVERRQQIGMLRAIGFTRGAVAVSFIMESSFITLLGVLSGIGLGLLLAQQLVTSENFAAGGSGVSFYVPWLQITGIGLFAFVASLLMTIIPSRQASSIPIAEALRYE